MYEDLDMNFSVIRGPLVACFSNVGTFGFDLQSPQNFNVYTNLIVDLSKQVNMHAKYAIQFENNVITDCQIREDYLRMKGNPSFIFPSPREISYRYNTGSKLTELNKKIVKMHQMLRTFVGPITEQSRSDHSSNRPTRWSSDIIDESKILGFYKDKRRIKEWIPSHSKSLHRVGIVGMGGLGKTTIVQKIYNDVQVKMSFEKKVWVSISQTYDEIDIMKRILR
ncbi:hypothetical protein FXO37_17578 [Capsicum annuum]|nr:hypothetical protein FXO37_17578 [Capsicum annuum]